MRALSDRELELIVGGYYDGSASDYTSMAETSDGYEGSLLDTVEQTSLDQFDHNADTMTEDQFSDYAVSAASAKGIDVGNGIRVTPVIDPFGKNKKFKIKLRVPC